MAFIVRYIKQERIDQFRKWHDRNPTAEEIEARKEQVKVDTEKGAEAIVQMLRESGHTAAWYSEEELQ